MLVTNHVLTGALVGLASPGPVTAFVGGVASHFALDAVPHWGDRPMEEVMPIAVADGLTGLAAIAVVWRRTPPGWRLRVLAGMAGASVPDLDKPGRVFLGASPFPRVVDDFHARIQTRESSARMPQEVLVGIGTATVLGLVLGRMRRSAGRSRSTSTTPTPTTSA
ncbi:hypothetical protein EUA93_05460 [Nocardioides oleivorans]|uniref:Uncharacterized protein n=1 Tax=Nocardioides oleivorans TaxID=273676 RepID=A0A4Q2S1E8_9ACTN|nr:hypothetical protein [Nocardioides oleivorans]RYB93853.1 hypothetical protein EUA93_05460 [Nocardioides oleivorans]